MIEKEKKTGEEKRRKKGGGNKNCKFNYFMSVSKHTFDTVHYNHYYINTDECIFFCNFR